MFTGNIKQGVIHNPLVQSPFVEDFKNHLISPGSPKFIVTESGLNLITEDEKFLETEG